MEEFFSTFSSNNPPVLDLGEGIEAIENSSYFTLRTLVLTSTLAAISFKADSYYGMAGLSEIEVFGNDNFEYVNDLLIDKVNNCVVFARKSITEVVFPESVVSITPGAFAGAERIKEVHIPASISEIPHRCFSGCSSLESITGGEGIKVIGVDAFGGCTKLKNVELPDTVEKIARLAFRGCKAISKAKLIKLEKHY